MYENDEIGYRPARRGPSTVGTIVTSILTTVVTFVALRAADQHGLLKILGGAGGGDAEVPAIVGMSPDQARELLKGRELLLTLEAERPDPKIPAGRIAAQTPLPGSRAMHGDSIAAVVSRGVGEVAVPLLAGLKPEDGARQLADKQLQAGPSRQEASATVAPGLVIGTDPPAGKTVGPGSAVTMIVSSGVATKPVPKVVGIGLSRAKKIIEEAGFKVGSTKYAYSERYDGAVVLKQDPAEGAPAAPGSEIQLIVNEPD